MLEKIAKEIILPSGQKVAYDVYGADSGRAPMILLHGWGCTASTLDSVVPIAAERYTVYNLDFPGFGRSPEPSEVWGVEDYTQMLEQFISALGITDPILLGHSFGGRVAILYASRNKVNKLVLVDAAGVKPHRNMRYYYRVYSFKLAKRLVQIAYSKQKSEAIIEKWRKRRASADYAAASPRMRAILSKVVNEDLCHVMPAISAPTLLIYGENDTATPVRDARKMERLIPDAGLVVFKGCGHYSFLDDPYRFAAVLRSFIN